MTADQTTFVKDLRPGLKNLNVIFIVLEIGESAVIVIYHPPAENSSNLQNSTRTGHIPKQIVL